MAHHIDHDKSGTMRPEVLYPIFAPLTALDGIGPKTAGLLEALVGANAVRNVLFHRPHRVIDRSQTGLAAEVADGLIATLKVTVEEHLPANNPRRPYRIRCCDESGYLTLAWFHARPDYLKRIAPVGAERIVSGKVERFGSEIQMLHPDHIVSPDAKDSIPAYEPVYPLTAGLNAKPLRKAIISAVAMAPELPEWLDRELLKRQQWPAWREAIESLHTPQSEDDLSPNAPARARLAYDELLADQLALSIVRSRRQAQPGRAFDQGNSKVKRVLDAAPFSPTNAQKRAAREIFDDMESSYRMGRLLQGDVGAGKTFVAALAAAKASTSGAQTAVMAPTEILARQHYSSLEPLLSAANISCAVLTGRDKGKGRAALLDRLKRGEVEVIIGTHALFQDDVAFHDLGLVIIDEQHRFGVSDRLRLSSKGERADLLVMTATPIPRTLSLAAFGDLDMSRLDEKPPGRTPIDTRVMGGDRLDDLMEAVGRAIEKGDRVYWVCPLVEESDRSELAAADERWRSLAGLFGDQRVGLLHGKLPAAEKEARAEAFRRGDLDILVATTVIEVGVDAPDATIMVIEHAERFGLAQLHQLRGRVGRGSKASTCVLLYHPPLTDAAMARLDVLRRTDDGFAIAEEDWRLRGPGQLLGAKQSGHPDFLMADLTVHGDLLDIAAKDARAIVARDPQLTSERGRALRLLLHLFDSTRASVLLRAG